MNRKHIHFAKSRVVRSGKQVYIYVDMALAMKDKIKFYESENGVILTEGDENGVLLPKYFC